MPFLLNVKEAFYAVNVGRLIKLHEEWMKQLPTVCPFYAVKCNNNPVILKILAALGTGFDCARKVRWSIVMSVIIVSIA